MVLEQKMEQRFEEMEHRFDFFQNLLLVLIAGVFGLIGFVVWDRKTAMKPRDCSCSVLLFTKGGRGGIFCA